MKIAVLAANGKVGRLVVSEALNAGHDVSAFVRAEFGGDKRARVIVKDNLALSASDLSGYEAIIDAYGVWDNVEEFKAEGLAVLKALSGAAARVIFVGGAGSSLVGGVRLVNTPDFPAEFKLLASAHLARLEIITKDKSTNWSIFMPAAEFDPNGPLGAYSIKDSGELALNSKGASYISYATYAKALIDEALKPKYIHKCLMAVQE